MMDPMFTILEATLNVKTQVLQKNIRECPKGENNTDELDVRASSNIFLLSHAQIPGLLIQYIP